MTRSTIWFLLSLTLGSYYSVETSAREFSEPYSWSKQEDQSRESTYGKDKPKAERQDDLPNIPREVRELKNTQKR